MRLVTRDDWARRLGYYVCVALTACAASCSGDDSPGPHETIDTPMLDASVLDAALRDGSEPDSTTVLDAAGGSSSRCRVMSNNDFPVAQRSFDPRSPISVAVHERGAVLSWSQQSGGESRVFSRWFSVGGDAIDAPNEQLSTQNDPNVSAINSGFLSTWTDDLSGTVELLARRIGDDGAALDATPITLSSGDSEPGASVSAQGADSKLLVAYRTASPIQGVTLLLGADAKPVGAPRIIPGFGALTGRPALAAFRTGYLLAWVDSSARHVHLQKLDAAGVPVGDSAIVDGDGDAQGNLDLTTTASGGAVSWDVLLSGVRAEVRLRTFGADGVPSGLEQNVTPFPNTGLRPSVVAAAGGYLVAYRSAEGQNKALRVVTLDTRLRLLPTALTIATLQQQDLPLAMRMSNDGLSIFVGWLDQTPDSTDHQLQRAWIGCD